MVPELLVADFLRSRAFYLDVLGFDVRFERTDPDFVYLSRDGAQLMLEADHDSAWRTDAMNAPRGRGINLQIEVADAVGLRDTVLAAGHRLFQERRATPPVTARKDSASSSCRTLTGTFCASPNP